MIENDTFWCTGQGPEFMQRQFGVAVLKGEDMAYQILDDALDAQGWYVWVLGEEVEGPYTQLEDAVLSVFDADSAEYAALMQATRLTYGL